LLSYKSAGYVVAKCLNIYGGKCEPDGEMIEFTCKKAGTVTIDGESTTGATTTSTIKITN
jgi:hypothetical protein